jgi:hypothetical protein
MHTSSTEPRAIVVVCHSGTRTARSQHEVDTQRTLAGQLALLLHASDCVDFDSACSYPPQRYFVPDDTLPVETARRLGIASDDDLFGGVVPYPFVGTKVVVHGLPPGAQIKPEGWQDSLGERVSELVLPGFSAFTRDDAHTAAALLLRNGPVRLKRPSGIGGAGQAVIADRRELDTQLNGIGDATLMTEGIVLERNLREITTFSVGEVRVRGRHASYYGVQRLTQNNHGHAVYGGSDLVVVRGTLDALQRTDMPGEARAAVQCAREFDDAIRGAFPGFIASRRNYDVASGVDENGHAYRGVLEQSWRIGGASGAEIGALRAFENDPALTVVRASTVELYGEDVDVPANAGIIYQGVDAHSGRVTKFFTVEPGPRTRGASE